MFCNLVLLIFTCCCARLRLDIIKMFFKVGSFEVMGEKLQPHFQIEVYLMCDIITILEKFVFISKSSRVAKYGIKKIFCRLHTLQVQYNRHVLHICTISHHSMSIIKMTIIRYYYLHSPPCVLCCCDAEINYYISSTCLLSKITFEFHCILQYINIYDEFSMVCLQIL